MAKLWVPEHPDLLPALRNYSSLVSQCFILSPSPDSLSCTTKIRIYLSGGKLKALQMYLYSFGAGLQQIWQKIVKIPEFSFFFFPLNTLDFPSCHCLVFEIAAALGIRWAPSAGSGAWYTRTEDFGFLKLCESCVTATLVPHVVHEAHGRQHIPSQHYATTTMHFAKCHSKGTLP